MTHPAGLGGHKDLWPHSHTHTHRVPNTWSHKGRHPESQTHIHGPTNTILCVPGIIHKITETLTHRYYKKSRRKAPRTPRTAPFVIMPTTGGTQSRD